MNIHVSVDGSGPMEEDSIPPEEAKSADAAAAQAVAVPSMRPQDLVVATLLELICFIHVQDQLKSKQLFRGDKDIHVYWNLDMYWLKGLLGS